MKTFACCPHCAVHRPRKFASGTVYPQGTSHAWPCILCPTEGVGRLEVDPTVELPMVLRAGA